MEDRLSKKEPKTKKKMSSSKKMIIFYSVELLVIAAVFITIAILDLTGVLTISVRQHIIFNFVTVLGGAWFIADFVWATFSSKRKERICYIDKILHLPLGLYLIAFDTIMFVHWNVLAYEVYLYGMTGAFLYIGICYTFEGIYHFFKPIPSMIEEEKKEDPASAESPKDDTNDVV